MRVAYFTNQYPAVSHTFIRREIRALEALGFTVCRYAIRCDGNIVDPEDRKEFQQTSYILKNFLSEFIRCLFPLLFLRPIALLEVLWLAVVMGRRSDRRMMRHFAYVAEAIVLGSWCRRDRIQHLHAHFGTNPAAVAMFASKFIGVPYSFTAHGSEEFEKAPFLSLDKKLEAAAFAVCVSYFGRAQLMHWSPPRQWSKVAVVHCGVDESFLTRPIRPIPSAPRFVCVGRFDSHKAQLILLAAAHRLHLSGVDFKLVLAGDGAWRKAIEDAIVKYELTDKVSITGWIPGDRVKAEIEASRALILASFMENMPVVIMEAMALGRPVISTYIAGIPEQVTPGETGWLVPASDDVALAEAMLEAIRATPDKLAAMGIKGRAKVTNNHSATIEAQKLKILFEGGQA